MEIKNQVLLKNLQRVEILSTKSKLYRLLNRPFAYAFALLFREIFHRFDRKPILKLCTTFYNSKFHVLLPSGTDIFITGGKSHHSEISLARFLIYNLKEGATFVDVGAHYGYYTLLASNLVGESGLVYSFEPSPKTFKVLNINTEAKNNIYTVNKAVSDQNSKTKFFEFPNKYSEYNTTDISQFMNLPWFKKNQPEMINIDTVILSEYLKDHRIIPDIIKIDVEGSELSVVMGLKSFLKHSSPIIIMEFLSDSRFNGFHLLAETELRSLGYKAGVILHDGDILYLEEISSYLHKKNSDSENIVFIRANN